MNGYMASSFCAGAEKGRTLTNLILVRDTYTCFFSKTTQQIKILFGKKLRLIVTQLSAPPN